MAGATLSRRRQPAAENAPAHLSHGTNQLADLPCELVTRIATCLPADAKKALRATCRMLRDAASAAVTHIELSEQFGRELRAKDRRRRAAALRISTSLPSIVSVGIHPPLTHAGTLVHKILRQLPNINHIALRWDESDCHPATMRPLTLCPALPSTLRSLVTTLPSSLAPISQLTSLTGLRLLMARQHPATLLTPLSHLLQLHDLVLTNIDAPTAGLTDINAGLLHPLAALPSLRTLGFVHLLEAMMDRDMGHSLAPLTQLTSLTVLSPCPSTINSVLSLSSLHTLIIDSIDGSPHFWQTGPRPTFPNLTAVIAPLNLIQSPATPHMPALVTFATTDSLLFCARVTEPCPTMLQGALSNLPLASLKKLLISLPQPHQTPDFLRALSGSVAPCLEHLSLRLEEQHLADVEPLVASLLHLPASLQGLELVCEERLLGPAAGHGASIAALMDMRRYTHLLRLARLHTVAASKHAPMELEWRLKDTAPTA